MSRKYKRFLPTCIVFHFVGSIRSVVVSWHLPSWHFLFIHFNCVKILSLIINQFIVLCYVSTRMKSIVWISLLFPIRSFTDPCNSGQISEIRFLLFSKLPIILIWNSSYVIDMVIEHHSCEQKSKFSQNFREFWIYKKYEKNSLKIHLYLNDPKNHLQ